MKKDKNKGRVTAVCDWCNRTVPLIVLGDGGDVRFEEHNARNGRRCHNAYGRPKRNDSPITFTTPPKAV